MEPLWYDRSANSVCDMAIHGQGGSWRARRYVQYAGSDSRKDTPPVYFDVDKLSDS